MRILATFAAALALAIAISSSVFVRTQETADAAFHFAEIHEIQVGFGGNPDIQFVEINMFSTGQGVVMNSRLVAWGPTGNYLGVVLNVPNGVNSTIVNQRWIMGTQAFETAAGIQADFEFAPGILSPTGGMICWGSFGGESNPNTHVDCVAYGSYSGTGGAAPPNGVTTDPPGDCDDSLTRTVMSTTAAGPPTTPYRGGNAANDFDLLPPSPRNNLNQNGTLVPADTDGDTLSNCVDPDADNDGWLNTCETSSSPARNPLDAGSVPMPPGGLLTNPAGTVTASDADADHAIDPCEASTVNPGGTTDPGDGDSDDDGVQDGVEEAAGSNPNANPADYSDAGGDDDGDGCTNGKELSADDANVAADRHPGNWWDFFSVDRNSTVGYDPNNNVDLSDTVDILAHFGQSYNGGAYGGSFGNASGQGYDRTRLLTPGPPGALIEGNNGIDLSEALANLAQFGFGGAGCVAPGPEPAQGGGVFS